MKDKTHAATFALLILVALLLLGNAAIAGLEMRADHLCLSAGFPRSRLVGWDVYCYTLVEGMIRVAKIEGGKIYVVIEGDELPPMLNRSTGYTPAW